MIKSRKLNKCHPSLILCRPSVTTSRLVVGRIVGLVVSRRTIRLVVIPFGSSGTGLRIVIVLVIVILLRVALTGALGFTLIVIVIRRRTATADF